MIVIVCFSYICLLTLYLPMLYRGMQGPPPLKIVTYHICKRCGKKTPYRD